MKFRIPKLGNTRLAMFDLFESSPGIPIDYLFVRHFYKRSKQPDKKLANFQRHARAMVRDRLIQVAEGRYRVTIFGRKWVAENRKDRRE